MALQKLFSLLFHTHLVFLALALGLTDANYGLRLGYYQKTCPDAELIIHRTTHQFISKAPTLAAPLLRMHFHDCFVRGCDGSILLNPTKRTKTEKLAIPNQSLRGFQLIDAAKSALEKKCPGVVSCADILAVVARDAVAMINGPYWDVHTGRRDGRVSLATEALSNLPAPFANITQLKQSFASKGLSVKDLAVLSGAHTIGIGHCFGFLNRLYNFTGKGDSDPSMDSKYVAQLKKKCKPQLDLTTFVEMDPGSFRTFDDHYYTHVAKRRGLFQSDAALLDDYETRAYVNNHVNKPYVLSFAQDFASSMIKMGSIEVLTGKEGEIRRQCGFAN